LDASRPGNAADRVLARVACDPSRRSIGRIEREPFAGRPELPDVLHEPTRHVAKGTLWGVLRDNRGGTRWTSVPIEIR
jgi:hypothetical protein